MRYFIFSILAMITATYSSFSIASSGHFSKGFVEIRSGRKLYVEQRLAQNHKATFVFVNGLTYSTKQWGALVDALDHYDSDYGIVLYDMVGMGETLLANVPIDYDIAFNDQVHDLHDLADTLALNHSSAGSVYLTGLSYGGGLILKYLSEYPEDFTQAIVMSPFLSRLPAQDKWITDMVRWHKIYFPLDNSSDSAIYNFYLHNLIFSTYPAAEPIVLENPYKLEAIFRMVKGALDWKALDITALLPSNPHAKLNLVSSTEDEYVAIAQQDEFWRKVPNAARASHLRIEGAHHKIPEEIPAFTAGWLVQIASQRPELNQGLTFTGDMQAMTATSASTVLSLKKGKPLAPP